MKYKILITGVAFIFAFTSCMRPKSKIAAANNAKSPTSFLNNQLDSLSYSMGVSIGKTIKSQGLDSVNSDAFAKGLEDIMKTDSAIINPEKAQAILSDYFQKIYRTKLEANAAAGKKYLEDNKTKEGFKTTESGLHYKVLKEGTGAIPKLSDKVKVHYHGTTTDGKVFDSSVDRGEPMDLSVNGVITGWTEALQMMKVGSKWRLVLPPDLAYGERGSPPHIGPNSVLIFDVELLGIEKQ